METSAVAYFFGKKIHQELDIPVGIIQRAYAGTPIEGWLPWAEQKMTHDQKPEKTADTASRMAENEAKQSKKQSQPLSLNYGYNAKIDAGETMKNKFKQLTPPNYAPGNAGASVSGEYFQCHGRTSYPLWNAWHHLVPGGTELEKCSSGDALSTPTGNTCKLLSQGMAPEIEWSHARRFPCPNNSTSKLACSTVCS